MLSLRSFFFISLWLLTLGSAQTFAQVGSVENLVYQGRIATGSSALKAGLTTFEVSILGGASNCLLYRETHTRDMTNASGHYSLAIGSGTRTDTLFGGSAPSHSLSDALRNIGSISGLDCGGSIGSFDPSLTPTIDRRFQLRFNPGGGWVSLPSQAIKSAPYAMQAMQVNGYGLSNLAKISGAGASTVMSPAGWAKVMDYSELGNLILGAGASLTCDSSRAGGMRYNAGTVEFCNGSSWSALASGGSGITALTGDVTASGSGSVSAMIATGAVTSTKILDGTIATADLADSVITAAKLNQMSATSGQVLKWNGSNWAPAADDNTAAATWSSLTGKPTTLSGFGITDAMSSTLNSGLIWVGNGSNVATARNLNITDVKSSVAGNFFTASGACAAGSSLGYTSISDSISCQVYAITSSQVTTALGFTPPDASLVVLKAGDTMTGALNLPSNGLVVGTNQLVVNGASIGVGTATPAATSLMEMSSTTKGVLIPRMTTAQRDAISSPATGLQVYNTTTNSLNFHNGTSWQALGVAGAGISSLTAGTGLTGGTITTSGTIAVDVGTGNNQIVQLNGSAQLPAVSGVNLTNLNATNLSVGTVPIARLPVGTIANTVAAGDDVRFTDSRAPTGSASGDLSGTYPNPAVASGAITSTKILDATIATADIADNAITTLKINDGSVTASKLNQMSATTNQVLKWNGSAWAPAADVDTGITVLTGDVTASGSGSVAAAIANDAVTYAKLQNVTATQRILGRFSAGAGDVEELSLGSGLSLSGSGVLSLLSSCASTEILKWNGSAWVCAADAGFSGLTGQTLATGQVLIGNGSNVSIARVLNMSDIRSTVAGGFVTGSGCLAGQALTYSSVTDSMSCTSISINASAIVAGTIDAARLPAAASNADGIINQIAQSFSGLKTFLNGLSVTGNITATGSVKVGTVATACDGSTEGTIRYNSTSKKMEFCNGTAWGNVSAGTIAAIVFGSPSAAVVKAGPVTYSITYSAGTDPGTVSLTPASFTFSGTGTTGCSVTSVTGSGLSYTATVNGCTNTGTVMLSANANTALSTTGDAALAAGPSASFTADNTGPNAPTGVSLGSVPANLTSSPTITYTAASDVGGSTVASHQVQITRNSDGVVMLAWTTHTSGTAVTGLTLATNTVYNVFVRALDAVTNVGTSTSASSWTTINDPCLGSPSPGQVCTGGAIFLGTLSPGATSGSGTDKYMTTPGGCTEIPAGQQGGGSGSTIWPNADFAPTCAGGTDGLTKTWNDGSSNWYDIPGLTNYQEGGGTGQGAVYLDVNYGSTNTTNIAAITSAGQGGYHAAARYCDRLNYGGYTDWYLPNRAELNVMWTNRTSLSGLRQDGTWYWSSTEYDSYYSWIQRFSDGYQGGHNKGNAYYVRCVRKF